MAAQNDRRLTVWQKAMDLTAAVYELPRLFPDTERFGLLPQLRRAAVSVPSKIAEGKSRGNDRKFFQLLRIA